MLELISKYIKKTLYLRRLFYVLCFALLCMIDQVIGAATGYIQYGLKNYVGIIIAGIILTSFKARDFLKIPYFIWLIFCFICKEYILTWWRSDIDNYLELNTNLVGVLIYGILVIRLIYLWTIERKRNRLNIVAFVFWILLMIGMIIIRSDFSWPKIVLIVFLLFYNTDFEEDILKNLYLGMIEGIILGFFIIQGQAWLFRPYDMLRYEGMYSHPNMNALFYCCVYCAVLCKWYHMKLTKRRWYSKGICIVLAGLVVGLTIFTGSRTALITMLCVSLVFLIFQMISRKKGKIMELIIGGLILFTSVALSILPAYNSIRYIPALVDSPIYFESDDQEKKINKGDAVNSEKYIELEEALEGLSLRFLWFVSNDIASKTVFNFLNPMVAHASDWSEWVDEYSYYNRNDEVYIEPGTDSKHPLLTSNDLRDPFKIRMGIYGFFVDKLKIFGEENSEPGVWLARNYYATHTHNVLLQMAYDFGILIGLLFVVLLIMLYNKVIFGCIERKNGSWYYQLFVMAGFITVFVVFGMLEISWIYGQLSFTMFWIVQYPVYHKQPFEVQRVQEKGKRKEQALLKDQQVEQDLEWIEMDE